MGYRAADRHAQGSGPTDRLPAIGHLGGRPRQSPGASAPERLLLAIYGYGTNTGIRAVAAGENGHGEDEIRYARRRYLTPEAARQIAIEIANATFAAGQQTLWGDGSTAVASDSTHFGAFDQNIFTEWHSRYGTGVRTGSLDLTLAATRSRAPACVPLADPCRGRWRPGGSTRPAVPTSGHGVAAAWSCLWMLSSSDTCCTSNSWARESMGITLS